MSIKRKPQDPYWTEFASYQSFSNVSDMLDQVKQFEKTYILTPAVKAVLNTIKLHAKKTFIGVCWLYREEIAKKAKVSLASVKRAIKDLREAGIITVYPHMNTLKGGKSHNVYVITPLFTPSNEPSDVTPEEPSEPTAPTVCNDQDAAHKNADKNPNTKSKDISIERFDILKTVPNEFINLLEPFYANNPKIIHARWKTVLSAVKKSCVSLKYTSFDTIGQAWTDVIKFYKRGKIKNSTDDGIGAYFYGVLCDYLLNDYLRNAIIS